MDSLNFKKTVYKINLYGTDYEMRKPTVREIMAFQKNFKNIKEDEEKVESLTSFFVSLGLTDEAVNTMQMDHMLQLAETLSGADKKK